MSPEYVTGGQGVSFAAVAILVGLIALGFFGVLCLVYYDRHHHPWRALEVASPLVSGEATSEYPAAADSAPGPTWARVMVDDEGYLHVATKLVQFEPVDVVLDFLDSVDPSMIEHEAISEFPDSSPTWATIEILKRRVRASAGGDEAAAGAGA